MKISPNYNFWTDIQKKKNLTGSPFFVLAPMADVTDPAFRRMFAKYGKPDVTWTEFVSADGLASENGRAHLLRDLEFTDAERPIVAQLFTSNPETMKVAVEICKELGYDGVDINMGCPDKNIEKQGAGAKMITTPERAIAVLRAAKEAAGDMPVSVKTRIGFNKVEIDTWLPLLLKEDLPALTVHLRTRKELSLVPAHWEYMEKIIKLNNEITQGKTLIIGNGDVVSLEDGKNKSSQTGTDGLMVGRGVFGTPWFFNTDLDAHKKTLKEQFDILLEHTKLFEELSGDIKSFAIMKKHYKAYVQGFDGAKDLRVALMECDTSDEIAHKLGEFAENNTELMNQVFER